MSIRTVNISFLILASVLYISCRSQQNSAQKKSNLQAEFSADKLAGSGNHFAADLFQELEAKEGNIIFSPYSIHTVLTMVYAGASGETAEQMAETLYLPPPDAMHEATRELRQAVLANDTLRGTEINLANAIWAQKEFSFLPEYVNNIRKGHESELTEMDFGPPDKREENRIRINNWVEDNTNNKIRDLLEPGVITANTRMVLTNAIYFNGQWKYPFDKARTAKSIFHVSDQQSAMVDFMHLNETLAYYEDNEIQALKLPYKGEQLSMTIILPKEKDGWEIVSRVLDQERLNLVETKFQLAPVYASVPKFKLELKLSMKEVLSDMGMDIAFDRNADFSGMTGEKNLFIDNVIHQAYAEVNETGTEAAAATGAVISLKSALRPEPIRFNADHPFLFLIRDQNTACIIFLGRLVKPS